MRLLVLPIGLALLTAACGKEVSSDDVVDTTMNDDVGLTLPDPDANTALEAGDGSDGVGYSEDDMAAALERQADALRYEGESKEEAIDDAEPETPVAPVEVEPAAATPRGNVTALFSSDDYPASAMRSGEQGTVAYSLMIDESGRVADCRIASSSGSAALDDATCSVLMRRARFMPAHDARNIPRPGQYNGRVHWSLP